MNGSHQDRELPELSNDQIETLYQICVSASRSASPPIKALFTEYDAYVEEQGLDPGHENALFRWICAIGDSTRQQHKSGQKVDLVRGLRSVLAAQGIETVLDDDEEDETRSLRISYTPPKRKDSKPERRVSFGDAHVEETWLSEHTESLRPPLAPSQNGLLNQPPRRGRDVNGTQRARSTSNSPVDQSQRPVEQHPRRVSSDQAQHYEFEDPKNPTLILEVSQTQLEQNAEAFCATSEWRVARRLLHAWHDQALALQSRRLQAWTIAVDHDRRKLLRESFDTLSGVHQDRRLERERALQAARWEEEQQARELEREADLERRLSQYQQQRNEQYVWKAFSNWYESLQYQRQCREVAKASILKVRYFTRWRKLTIENATKARIILARKYLKLWNTNTAQRAIAREQAEAHYEESLMRRCVQRWFWNFCSRRVEGWREQRMQRRTFESWIVRLHTSWSQDDRATEFRNRELLRVAMGTLSRRADELQLASQTAESLAQRKLTLQCFGALQLRAKLMPAEKTLKVRVDLDLKRKALGIWQLHLRLTKQAAEVDHKRILQSAWTSWNDALRCKALSQRIDERVQVEALYKWVLQARLRSFERARDSRLVHRALNTWISEVRVKAATLSQIEGECKNNQRWRLLRFGMTSLNRALRQREDAARTAVEFANSRALPNVLDVWKERSAHARTLVEWAADARFYVLATRTLRLWRERTEQHKHQRRRDAYAQIRSTVKIRIVGHCLNCLRSKNADIQVMKQEADQRKRTRLYEIGTTAFDRMREKTAHYAELAVQAQAMDHHKLLGSALSALVNEHVDLETLDQQAVSFRQETDLALLAGALKRMQWVTFTAARRAESADALWARNRDQHIKHMLRHWASQAATRKASKDHHQDFPESPSTRPASRAAARSAERPSYPSSPPTATPGYMRTPSRTRRAGRFKPLPTPALFTPFAFDQSYLATTPGPLIGARPDLEEENAEATDVFEALTPQITPFARKLRAGGIGGTPARAPQSALRSSVFGRSIGPGGTAKSVRFAGSRRFGSGLERLSSTGESS
ncbi:hypothetical protein Slin15195_G065400 [Septoria linicola]|uniref:Sfi1 spindle body domain-containing protein n=1 Tax=Septoria linicola TaxID=215465 RepID=A0A9Q9EIX2_9PEZI|nr:hypothetical protein Slin14017_G115740 [Septoria linicola]USW53221.1 hypothetical protein Slin15195_G065400 [Septoria linicola]